MAIGAAVVVVLAIAVVLLTKPPGGAGGGRGGPPEVLTGEDGSRVEISATWSTGLPSLAELDREGSFFTVHLHNTGPVPVSAQLDPDDTWALGSTGQRYPASTVISPGARAEPGGDYDAIVVVEAPAAAWLKWLHVGVPMGGGYRPVDLAL
jgi:hypothetical protein